MSYKELEFGYRSIKGRRSSYFSDDSDRGASLFTPISHSSQRVNL